MSLAIETSGQAELLYSGSDTVTCSTHMSIISYNLQTICLHPALIQFPMAVFLGSSSPFPLSFYVLFLPLFLFFSLSFSLGPMLFPLIQTTLLWLLSWWGKFPGILHWVGNIHRNSSAAEVRRSSVYPPWLEGSAVPGHTDSLAAVETTPTGDAFLKTSKWA